MSRAFLRSFALLASLVVLLLCAGTATAQRAHIQISSGPYYQGEPVDIHLVVEDFEESPEPRVDVKDPKGGRLELLGVNPSTRSSISITNGRMTQTKAVRFVYQYRFIAATAGRFQVGPFRVEQKGVERTTGPVQLQVAALGKSDRVRIDARWPRGDVYPGQRMTVEIEWWFASDLTERMHEYRIEVPMFNRTDLFRFADTPPEPGDTELIIETPTGRIALKATVTEKVDGNRRFKVVNATRILIPLQPGEFNFAAPTVVVDEVTRWRRDLFGQRTPQGVRKVPSSGEPRKLIVRDVPRAGRPDTYAGAIGRGFSLEVTADRSVLQAGDPIALTLVLRGDGNLDGAGLPDLAAGGLSPKQFRSPTGSPGGVVADGAKTFQVQVRVLDDSVREIPPIPYTYFDSDKKDFVTVTSRPIALSVRRGHVVTADDVVSGAVPPARPGTGAGGQFAASADIDDASDGRAATGALSLTGANLSIVRDHALLLSTSNESVLGKAGVASVYGASLALVAFAFAYRRRSDQDPAVVRRNKLFGTERRTIAGAASMPRAEAMSVVAGALRSMLRAASVERPAGLDAFLSECDAVAYAPDRATLDTVDPEVIARAQSLADEIEKSVS